MAFKLWQTGMVLLGLWAVAQPTLNTRVEAQLNPFFYLDSCPRVYSIVGRAVYSAIQEEARIAASLLRLHFHDCFVQGCDASILLDDTETETSEKSAIPNINSVRGFGVIDSIKASVESSCPGIVSCADVLALASFFSVILSRGPIWFIPLGRRDSLISNFDETIRLPNPATNVTTLKENFAFQNLTVPDLVALSGGHTIGLARCVTVASRLYNFSDTEPSDPTLNATLLAALQENCPFGGDGNVTNNMDIQTPTVFDNLYYQNLLQASGIFPSDQTLFNDADDTSALVQLYASDKTKFFDDFVAGMVRMGNLNVLTGTDGEIRTNCSVRNSPTEQIEDEVVRSAGWERRGGRTTSTDADWEESRIETQRKSDGTTRVERHESAEKFFRDIIKQIAEEIRLEEAQKLLVEDTNNADIDAGRHFTF